MAVLAASGFRTYIRPTKHVRGLLVSEGLFETSTFGFLADAIHLGS